MSGDTAQTHDARLVAMQAEIADLRRSVRRLERQQNAGRLSHPGMGDISTLSTESGLEQAVDDVRQLTEAMFPGEVSVETTADPESPEERFVVFNVTATGDEQQLLRRQRQWHEEVLRRARDASNFFRISIVPG